MHEPHDNLADGPPLGRAVREPRMACDSSDQSQKIVIVRYEHAARSHDMVELFLIGCSEEAGVG